MRNLCVGMSLVLFAGAVFAADGVPDDKAKLQGEWSVKDVTTTTGGERTPPKIRFNFQGDKVVGVIDVGAVAEFDGTYELKASQLTIHTQRPLAGGAVVIHYKYEFEGGNLVLCRFDDRNAATAAPSSCTTPNVRRLDLVRPAE